LARTANSSARSDKPPSRSAIALHHGPLSWTPGQARGDEEGASGDEEGASGDEEGASGDEEGASGDEEGASGDEEAARVTVGRPDCCRESG